MPPKGITPRKDEASLSTDADNDGIVDFDEQNRFATSATNNDTDADCVLDKQDIRSYIFNNLGAYPKRWSDYDGDGRRKEVDADNDNGGWLDGDEDKNWNGKSVDAGRRRDGVDTSNFNRWDDRPGPCSPSPTPTRIPPTPTRTPTRTPSPTFTPRRVRRQPQPQQRRHLPARRPQQRRRSHRYSYSYSDGDSNSHETATTATETATATATATSTATPTGTATATVTAEPQVITDVAAQLSISHRYTRAVDPSFM